MAYTESEKRELINSIKAESMDVTRLEPIDTLEGVTSLPVLSGTRLVTAPVSILGRPALDAAESANEAAAAANEAAEGALEAARLANEAAENADTALDSVSATIAEMANTLWPLELEVTPSFTLAEYTGDPVALNVTRRVLRKGQPVNGSDISSLLMTVSNNDSSVIWDNTATFPQKICEGEVTDYGIHRIILQVTACGMTASVQKDVRLELPCYFGFSAIDNASHLGVSSLQKQSIRTSPNGTYSLQNPTSGHHMWLCVPSRMSITKVVSNGFDVPMLAAQTVSTELGDYKCYRSASESGINQGTIKITIS